MKSKVHGKRVDRIAKKLDIPRSVVHLIIREYFNALRTAMHNNLNVHVRGFFRLKRKK